MISQIGTSIEVLEQWAKKSLEIKLGSDQTVIELYNNYIKYVSGDEIRISTIPFRKKTFVTQLKRLYKKAQEDNQIQFFYDQDNKSNEKSDKEKQERSMVRGFTYSSYGLDTNNKINKNNEEL